MRITADWLRKHAACDRQVKLFESLWPKGLDVTEENLRLAYAKGLNVFWLSHWEQMKASSVRRFQRLTDKYRDAENHEKELAWKAYRAMKPSCKSWLGYARECSEATTRYHEAVLPVLAKVVLTGLKDPPEEERKSEREHQTASEEDRAEDRAKECLLCKRGVERFRLIGNPGSGRWDGPWSHDVCGNSVRCENQTEEGRQGVR